MAEIARAFYLAAAANLAACATNHAAHEPPSIGPPAPARNNTPTTHWWQAAWQDFRKESLVAKSAYVVGAAGTLFLADTFLHHYANHNNENQPGGGAVCPPGTSFVPVANATNAGAGSTPAYSCVYQNDPQGSKHSSRALSLHFGRSW